MGNRLFLAAVALLLLSTTFALLLVPPDEDPLAEFRQADGSFRFSGEMEDFERVVPLLLGYGRPQPTRDLTFWTLERSSHPTAVYQSTMFQVPNLNVYVPHPREDSRLIDRIAAWLEVDKMARDLRPISDAISGFLSFEWLVGRASAAAIDVFYTEFNFVAASTTEIIITPGFQAEVIIMWMNGRTGTADAVGGASMTFSMGFATSTTDERAICSVLTDAAGSTQADGMYRNDSILCSITKATTGALDGLANITTINSTQVGITPQDAMPSAYRVQVLVLGGTALTNADVGDITEPGATGNQTIVVSPAFQPEGLILMSVGKTAANTVSADGYTMVGLVAGSGDPVDFVWSAGSDDAQTTMFDQQYNIAAATAGESIALYPAVLVATPTATEVDGRASVNQWNSDGFQVNWAERASTRVVNYLAIDGISMFVGDFLTQNVLDEDITETGFGFSPSAAFFVSGQAPAVAVNAAPSNVGYEVSTGAFASVTARGALASRENDNVGTAVVGTAQRANNQVMVGLTTADGLDTMVDTQSIESSGFILNMDDPDPVDNTNIVGFIAFGVAIITRFLVLADAQCTITTVSTDTDCWSTTSGGDGNGVPADADNVVMDANSGASTGVMDARLPAAGNLGTANTTGFTGAFQTSTFDFFATGTFTHAGGTLTISGAGGGFDVGAATISAPMTSTAAGDFTFDSLTISASTLAKDTSTLTVQGALTMSGGDITSTSGAASVTGNVNISSAASAIDFGSEAWTVSGTWTNSSTDATWDAGTGSILFDSATGGTMTFAGANLSEAEFNSVTFTSSAGSAQTFTMATRGLRLLSTLSITDASSTTTLATADLAIGNAADTADLNVGNGGIFTANASTVILGTVTMTGGTSGVITVTTGAWTISGNWNTGGASSIYTQGTGIVTFDATATITMLSTDNTFDDLTISAGTATIATNLIVTNALTISGGTYSKGTTTLTAGSLAMSGGDFTSTSGNVSITGAVNISSASSAIDFGSESWTVSGAFDCASTDTTVWDAGTGTITFDSATGDASFTPCDFTSEAHFNNVTFSSTGGTAQTFTLATRGLRWAGTLTVSDVTGGTTLAKGTQTLDGGALTLAGAAGGSVTSTSGDVAVSTVDIQTAASFIDLGSEAWTISGTWTNATTSASWDAGTGTVTFTSATGGTMTFAGANLAEAEFNNATFTSSAGTPQTFTMATRALRWSTTLTISDGTSTTELATSDLGLSTGAISVGNGGILTVNASTVSITSFTMTGGTSGTLTLTTGSWTLSGNWDSSGAGSTFTQGNSTITMSGAGTTITLRSGDSTFNNLTISAAGTVTLASEMTVAGTLTVNSGAVLALATFIVAITTLAALAGGITAGASGSKSVSSDTTISATGYFSFGGAPWTFSGTWTNDSTNASWDAGSGTVTFDDATAGTMTFAGANLSEAEFNHVTFNSGAGTPQTFTMATRSLRIAGTLTVTDSSSTTTLDTANLNIQANVVDCLTNGTINIGTGNFLGLVTFNIDGDLVMDGITVGNIFMTRTTGTGIIDITLWTAWATGANVDVRWTFSPSVSGDTWQFVLEDVVASVGYDLLRNTIIIDQQTAVGTVVTLSEAGAWAAGDQMQINETVLGRFIVLNDALCDLDVWSDTGCWSTTSGGAGGATLPDATLDVTCDTNSGTSTFTVDVNATMKNMITTSGCAVTIAIGTFNYAVNGDFTHGGGTVTIGNSSTSGLTVTGGLTISGAANISAGTATEIVSITGNVSVSATTAYIDFGAGTWTLSGSWSNSTTAASWDAGTGLVLFNSASGATMTFAGTNLSEAEFFGVRFFSSSASAVVFSMATRGLRAGGELRITDSVSTTELDTNSLAVTAGLNTATAAVTISSGGILTADDSLIQVFGNWSAVGTFNSGTSEVQMKTAGSTIDSGFFDLTIDADTTLAEDLTVLNQLTVNAVLGTANFAMTLNLVTISAAGAITLGTNSHTVSGTWTNNTTSASWDKGSGTVTFTALIGATMIFAGSNLAEDEFQHATFNSTGVTPQTFTMSTRSLRIGGTLTVTDSVSTTMLSTSNLNLQANSIQVAANGIIAIGTGNFLSIVTFNIDGQLTMDGQTINNMFIETASGTMDITLWTAWAVGGNVDVRWTFTVSNSTATLTFTLEDITALTIYQLQRNTIPIEINTSDGAGTVMFVHAGGWGASDAMAIDEVASTGDRYLVMNDTLCSLSNVTTDIDCWSIVSGGPGGASAPSAGNNVIADGFSGSGTGIFDANMMIVTGTFNSTGFNGTLALMTFMFSTTGTFTHAGGTITLSTGSLDTGAATVSAAITATGAGSMTFDGLTLSASTITKGTATFTVQGALNMTGGDILSTSGVGSVTGNVTISATSAIDFGSATWTFSGTWTNNSTDSAVWDAGTGIMHFNSATGGTMIFAGTNLPEPEFFRVEFNRGFGGMASFTMSTRGLRWADLLTVTDTVSLTTLATSDLPLTGGSAVIDNLGQLTANGSTVSILNFTITGTTAGLVTLTTGSWIVAGNWNSSTVGAFFDAGTSTVTMTGSAKTVAQNSSANDFDTLIISGTVSQGTNLWARVLAVNGTLVMTGFDIIFKQLTVTPGTLMDAAVAATNFQVDNTEAAARTTVSSLAQWDANDIYEWVHTSSSPTTTITFTIGGNTPGATFVVTKNAAQFADGVADGMGNVVFQILGGDPTMVVTITQPPPPGGGGLPPPVLPPFQRPVQPFEFGYIIAGITAVLMLLAVTSRRDPRRFWLTLATVALLGLTASTVLVSAIPLAVQGLMLVGLAAFSFAVALLPSRHQRSRPLWVALGVLAAVLGAGTTAAVLGLTFGAFSWLASVVLTTTFAAYALAAATAAAIIGTMVVKSERRRYVLAVLSVAGLGALASGILSVGMPVVLNLNLGYILLAFAGAGVALAVIPTTKRQRYRGAWLVFSVAAFALWFLLVL